MSRPTLLSPVPLSQSPIVDGRRKKKDGLRPRLELPYVLKI